MTEFFASEFKFISSRCAETLIQNHSVEPSHTQIITENLEVDLRVDRLLESVRFLTVFPCLSCFHTRSSFCIEGWSMLLRSNCPLYRRLITKPLYFVLNQSRNISPFSFLYSSFPVLLYSTASFIIPSAKGRGVRVEFEITPSPGFLLHLSVEQELHCTDTCSCILNLYSLIKNYCMLCQLSNNLLQSAMTSCGSVELLRSEKREEQKR